MNAYRITRANQEDLSAAMAQNPIPAFQILQNYWNSSSSASRGNSLLAHIRRIAHLYASQVVVLLEPNMHAKFVACESNIYEGSGNLTYHGLNVNVEVYNFYPRASRVYAYAARSYIDFLRTYLLNFVTWKSGQTYLYNASALGLRLRTIAGRLSVSFNPMVSQEKINAVSTARDELATARSDIWQLRGHSHILNFDLLLNMAYRQLNMTIGQLYSHRDKELSSGDAKGVEGRLSASQSLILRSADSLAELVEKGSLAWYETEYLPKTLEEAKRFSKYLESFDINKEA